MIELKIKPLSVNEAWQGRRFKTYKYEQYEKEVIWSLPPITLPEPPFHITFKWGFSNMRSDVDNPTKNFMDCLSKKYRFNDADVHKITAEKVKVKKGAEFVAFRIEKL